MPSSSQFDNSLAFVDVITNGLGGMLVLFFIVILVQTQLEWKEAFTTHADAGGKQPSPFVLIVKSKDGRAVFNPQTNDSVWRFDGASAGAISSRRGVQWDWGSNYALFVANHAPGLNARASVATPAIPTTFVVELYPAGAPKKTYDVDAEVGKQFTEIWPPRSSR